MRCTGGRQPHKRGMRQVGRKGLIPFPGLAARQLDVVFYMPWITPLLTSHGAKSTGGAETQILLLARALARRGRRVAIIVFDIGDAFGGEVDGVRMIRRPSWRGSRGLLGKAAELVIIPSVMARTGAGAFVQRSAGVATGLVAVGAKLRGRHFIYSSANVIDFDLRRLEGRANVALYHVGIRLANTIVVQTEEQRDLCRKRFNREPVLIRSLCEPAELRTAGPDHFLWIGRVRDYKDPLAFVRLARSVPQARFSMVAVDERAGPSALMRAVRHEAEDVENLELLEPRPRRELMSLISTAVAIVNTAEYEGMPNIFLEGWARGVPALALRHDPDGVIARERLGAYAAGSADGLAALAAEMWRDRDSQAEVAQRCRDYVEREHGIDAVAGRWETALGLRGGRERSLQNRART